MWQISNNLQKLPNILVTFVRKIVSKIAQSGHTGPCNEIEKLSICRNAPTLYCLSKVTAESQWGMNEPLTEVQPNYKKHFSIL